MKKLLCCERILKMKIILKVIEIKFKGLEL